MFTLTRLRWRRWRAARKFHKEWKKLKKRGASRDEFNSQAADEVFTMETIGEEIDRVVAIKLWRDAHRLDIAIPPLSEKDMWVHSNDGEYTFLSAKGRAIVRKLVDEEKARRFEVKTLWVTKFWLPLLAAFVGIIGALTGLIAVWHRK